MVNGYHAHSQSCFSIQRVMYTSRLSVCTFLTSRESPPYCADWLNSTRQIALRKAEYVIQIQISLPLPSQIVSASSSNTVIIKCFRIPTCYSNLSRPHHLTSRGHELQSDSQRRVFPVILYDYTVYL